VDVARQAGTHPRELCRAIDQGLIDGSWVHGEVHVSPDDIAAHTWPQWTWTSVAQWAEDHGTYYRDVRRRLAAGEIDGVDEGNRRRWVLELSTPCTAARVHRDNLPNP